LQIPIREEGVKEGGRDGGRGREATALFTKCIEQGTSEVEFDLGRLLLQGCINGEERRREGGREGGIEKQKYYLPSVSSREPVG